MPPFATRRSHGIQTNFSTFLRVRKVPKFRLFWDLARPAQSARIAVRTASWQVRPRSAKVPEIDFLGGPVGSYPECQKSQKIKIFRIFAIFAIFAIFRNFCDFFDFSRFLRFLQKSTNLPKSTISDISELDVLRCQKSKTAVLFGHGFEFRHASIAL